MTFKGWLAVPVIAILLIILIPNFVTAAPNMKVTYEYPKRCANSRYKNYYYVVSQTGTEALLDILVNGTTICVTNPVGDLKSKKIRLKTTEAFKASDIKIKKTKFSEYCYTLNPKTIKSIKIGDSTIDIILLEDAWYLNSTRDMVENITVELKDDDHNIKTFQPGEYARVKFEIPLDSSRIINVYLRNMTNGTKIELYENGSDTVLSTDDITDDYRFANFKLSNLTGQQTTFDFKILGGSVDIDYIVDPECVGSLTADCNGHGEGDCGNYYEFMDPDYVQCFWMPAMEECGPIGGTCTPGTSSPEPEDQINIPPIFQNMTLNVTMPIIRNETFNFSASVYDPDSLISSVNCSYDMDITETDTIGNPYTGSYAWTWWLNSERSIGQTFKPKKSGYLYNVSFNLSRFSFNGIDDLMVDLWYTSSHRPTGTSLSTATFKDYSIYSGWKAYEVVFTKPFYVKKDTVYALTLTCPGCSDTYLNFGAQRYRNYYPDGMMIYKYWFNPDYWYTHSGGDMLFNLGIGDFNYQLANNWSPNAQSFDFEIPKTPLWSGDAPKHVKCLATDDYGATSQYIYNLYISNGSITDNEMPSGSILFPVNNSAIGGVMRFRGTAQDNVGITNTSMQWRTGGGKWNIFGGCEVLDISFICINDFRDNETWNMSEMEVSMVPCDLAGNCNRTAIMNYSIDHDLPLTQNEIIYHGTHAYPGLQSSVKNGQPVHAALNTTDNVSGIDSVMINWALVNGSGYENMTLIEGSTTPGNWSYWAANGTVTTGLNGTHHIEVLINDTLGNTLNASLSINFDNMPPTWSSINHDGGDVIYNGTNLSITFNSSDNYNQSTFLFDHNQSGAFANTTTYNYTGESVTNSLESVNLQFTNGSYAGRFHFWDNAGNYNITDYIHFEVVGQEPEIENLSLVSPQDDANITSPTTFSFNYTGSPADNCSLVFASSINQTISSPAMNTTVSFEPVTLATGINTWMVMCNNSYGTDYISETWRFNITSVVSNTTPTVTLYNSSGVTTDSAPGIDFNFTDDDSVAKCYLLFNGTAYGVNASAPESTRITITANDTLANDDYSVTASCSDGANTGTSSAIILSVNYTAPDLTPPDISYINPTPADDTNLSQNNYFVNVSINEAANWVGLELTNASGTINYTMTNEAGNWYNLNVTGQANYETYFYVYANDSAGNLNRSLLRRVNISDDKMALLGMGAYSKGMEWMAWNWTNGENVSSVECELLEGLITLEFFNTTLQTYNRSMLHEGLTYNLTCRGYDVSGAPGPWYEVTESTASVLDKTIVNLRILKNWLKALLGLGGG